MAEACDVIINNNMKCAPDVASGLLHMHQRACITQQEQELAELCLYQLPYAMQASLQQLTGNE